MNTQLTPLQRLSEARKAFFQDGNIPNGIIDEAILNSWKRCIAEHKSVTERVIYETVPCSRFNEIKQKNQNLTNAATIPIEQLHRTISGAGYALLLTDRQGHALCTYQANAHSGRVLKQAFRPGVNLSEQYIGTSAMSCALTAGRPVAVSGPEHYYTTNQSLNCAAAPIIAPYGQVIGSIDITREHSLAPGSALSLVTQCARAIEHRLIMQLRPYLILQLSWQQVPTTNDMLIALGPEGEILGMTPKVREVIGLTASHAPKNFQELFDLRFGELVDAARGQRPPLLGRTSSGLSFVLNPTVQHQTSLIEGTATCKDSKRHLSAVESVPDFGDATLNKQIPLALRAVNKRLPVLILGETGVGKEVMAKTLHEQSDNKTGEFIAINCAAIPETLIESELFGYTEGAYTGARRGGAPGKIEQANGGTLFLDEIGDMPLTLQSRLLRVLETHEVSRLGAGKTKSVNFQLICATHHDLASAVAQGAFRDDLLYRIQGMPLRIPPLRERSRLQAFLVEQCSQVTQATRQLSFDALKRMENYPWPGNVRELRHALKHADVMADDSDHLIDLCHLPTEIVDSPPQHSRKRYSSTLKAQEQHMIEAALEKTDGNISKAAKHLGIGRATLYRKIKEIQSIK
ncbi:sigma-54-dependent Fis family transcriptional regulator [Vreelandella titanicae]|uniref:RNA polymerase sigma factor 54, interaction n=1 Tax=Vreelandella titanicae BH1 TaxID=1204738 RepID=L9UD30_9GAMM|nr:sigma-54-dependent Fis family transcriptional regulator [Halomonas titanicae]ELY22794.1 RNA polymerase sigma factor 54, interaction [Halomonas titanicae BH1]MCE7517774.1 sigma-54-dependent Fis family transcriptional regulator [Halomonas titanicae]NVE89120.1 sigma-54-dependent Fis family transcriptional regulator [Halomonas titanicae]|tara:strand:+ start:778 stop:2670 length:1893 start_codon:yes stop_codon:yes gene_type:complete